MLHRLAYSCFPPSLTVVGHKTICQIGALESRDWEDYDYVLLGCCAGGGQGAGLRDPLAYLYDVLPGLRTGDINALLQDLRIPIAGNVPGMTVEEAIALRYNSVYVMVL
jgi:hypothetical protein